MPAAAANDPDTARFAVWYDVFGLDSVYDYDPVWEKCVELGIAPTFHSAGSNQGLRNSPTNFTYNHIGHFADAGHADRQGDLPRRRHPALPGAALCLPRRRRRLGLRSCSAI